MNTAYFLATAVGPQTDVTHIREKSRVCVHYAATTTSPTTLPGCEQWLDFDMATGVLSVENPVVNLASSAESFFKASSLLPVNKEMEAETDRFFRERRAQRLQAQVPVE